MNFASSILHGGRSVRIKLTDNWKSVQAAAHRSELRGLTLMTQNLRRIEKGQIKYRPFVKKNTKGYWDRTRRPVISMPGQPPYARTRAFKNAFHYAVDKEAMTGWVGPITFRRPKSEHVPHVLEFGGKSNGGKSNITPWIYRNAPSTIDNVSSLADWAMNQKAGVRPTDRKGKTNVSAFSPKTGRTERYYAFYPQGGVVTRSIAQRTATTLAEKFGFPSNYTLPETIAEHPYARPALIKAKRDFPRFLAHAMQRGMK